MIPIAPQHPHRRICRRLAILLTASLAITQLAITQMAAAQTPATVGNNTSQRWPTQHLLPDQPTAAESRQSSRVSRTVTLMTTPVEFVIQLALESAPELIEQTATANQAIDEAIGEIQRIEQVMSEWQPHSEVSQINSAAGTGPVAISEELYRLLQMALQVSELSGGRFDITFRSAGKLWDFRHQIIPTQAQIEAAITAIDYHKVRLQQSTTSPTGYLAEITSANTSMGLGAIAKGYAIDRAVQVIRRAGFQQFVVNAGGDLYASSVPGQPLWQVGIQHPRQREQLIARLPVANMAVATSGDYERYFIHNGQRYSHLINPATGYPANGCQSVTIMASRGFWADALATAVFVMGPQEGMALVEQLDDVEAMVIDAAGIEHLSSGFTL